MSCVSLARLATDDGGLQSFPHNRQGVHMLSTNILRYKESDRLNAIMVELTKLDAAVSISDDGDTLIIVRPDNFNQRPSIPTMTTEWQLPSAC